MAFELVVSARAEEEAISAIMYYDQINPRLGDRFFIELLTVYGQLTENPQYYSFISATRHTTLRDVKLPSFPYVVIYDISGSKVLIISVQDCYRKPFIS
jgi:hypothetical protein